MSPLSPSDSVDAFLSWLAAPASNTEPTGPVSFVPTGRGSVSDQEYAARLRELARSPLEDMAKPLLGPIPVNVSTTPGSNGEGGKTPKPKTKHAKKPSAQAKAQ
ncbi:uncharacterized protein FOMMEDRAFT_16050 [Fomitiporia mediterranea MF3/22]|uniref:uncharacterized protein n=1 Tax=Fomitiporia mediterranea (strain MF3/22) TaxID=694068 RepID=UPI0004408B0B|nr:uncharacterized protein FOMMEDRAFT_16050 [Fomitiporia mediterranea MF3/22]EJD07350.1 hypothetical protein FOMMEDRAFT_16050 [Fomitiporia mediterranea MF3/22]